MICSVYLTYISSFRYISTNVWFFQIKLNRIKPIDNFFPTPPQKKKKYDKHFFLPRPFIREKKYIFRRWISLGWISLLLTYWFPILFMFYSLWLRRKTVRKRWRARCGEGGSVFCSRGNVIFFLFFFVISLCVFVVVFFLLFVRLCLLYSWRWIVCRSKEREVQMRIRMRLNPRTRERRSRNTAFETTRPPNHHLLLPFSRSHSLYTPSTPPHISIHLSIFLYR